LSLAKAIVGAQTSNAVVVTAAAARYSAPNADRPLWFVRGALTGVHPRRRLLTTPSYVYLKREVALG
jgi:hypothetical protein